MGAAAGGRKACEASADYPMKHHGIDTISKTGMVGLPGVLLFLDIMLQIY
jgi:hypothetical protein